MCSRSAARAWHLKHQCDDLLVGSSAVAVTDGAHDRVGGAGRRGAAEARQDVAEPVVAGGRVARAGKRRRHALGHQDQAVARAQQHAGVPQLRVSAQAERRALADVGAHRAVAAPDVDGVLARRADPDPGPGPGRPYHGVGGGDRAPVGFCRRQQCAVQRGKHPAWLLLDLRGGAQHGAGHREAAGSWRCCLGGVGARARPDLADGDPPPPGRQRQHLVEVAEARTVGPTARRSGRELNAFDCNRIIDTGCN